MSKLHDYFSEKFTQFYLYCGKIYVFEKCKKPFINKSLEVCIYLFYFHFYKVCDFKDTCMLIKGFLSRRLISWKLNRIIFVLHVIIVLRGFWYENSLI
jgi:hypothetical protein